MLVPTLHLLQANYEPFLPQISRLTLSSITTPFFINFDALRICPKNTSKLLLLYDWRPGPQNHQKSSLLDYLVLCMQLVLIQEGPGDLQVIACPDPNSRTRRDI